MLQAVTRARLTTRQFNIFYAGVAELADAQDLGSCVNSCRFKSCHPHQTKKIRTVYLLQVNGSDHVFDALVFKKGGDVHG